MAASGGSWRISRRFSSPPPEIRWSGDPLPLPQPYPEIPSLDLLVSVGELGSISAAARAHHLTQPAASMRLRSLEEALQVTLLERSPSGARLTPAGLAMVEWADGVLREMRALLAGTAALRADLDSRLQVAASLTVAEYLVPRWLERLARSQPPIAVSLQMGNSARVVELVAAGTVELGFIESPHAPEGLESEVVAGDELVVMVARDHPWAGLQRTITAAELAATPLVLREIGSGTREVLAEALAALGLEPQVALELGSTTAIKAAAIAGAGPAVLSLRAAASELRDASLVAVTCEAVQMKRAIRAIWAGPQLSRAGRQLLEVAATDR